MIQIEIIALLLLAVVIVILQIVLLSRGRAADIGPELAQLQHNLQQHQQNTSERTERELRTDRKSVV